MNRNSKCRFLPQLDSLEGRQLLAGVGSAGFGRVLLAVQDAADADASRVPAPSMRARNQIGFHADRNGAAARPRSPKNGGMQRRPKGNLRRQPAPQFFAPQAPAPPPTAPAIPTPPAAAAVPSVAIPASEQAIIDLTNQQRMLNGLAPLAASEKLVQAAQIHAGNMARLDQMSHTLAGVAQPDLASRAQAVGYDYAKLGENIAFRYAGAPEVVAGWMDSAGHRANILDPSYTEIGVAIAANSRGELYYCQVFGKTA